MQKQQNLLTLRHEIKKDRVPGFPYYVVYSIHQVKEYYFLVAADYTNHSALLTIYPFKQDLNNKLATVTISLDDIMPRKIISFIHIQNLNFKATIASVSINSLELILGYRSGQIIILSYQDKQLKIKCRLNKTTKGEGFMFKASSMFFGSDNSYTTYFNFPARLYIKTNQYSFQHSYLVGPYILFSKELNQAKQSKFLLQYEDIDLQNNLGNRRGREDNILYSCDYFTVIQDNRCEYRLITMKNEICSYVVGVSTNELYIASKEHLYILDLETFKLKKIITTQTPIRKINFFLSAKQPFLAILLYQNYYILYSIKMQKYVKIMGHKSFVANIYFDDKQRRIVSAGMDHRIGIIFEKNINQNSWRKGEQKGSNIIIIDEIEGLQVRIDEIYGLGLANIGKGKNGIISYGYGDLTNINQFYCLPTYDSKILIYQMK